MKLISYGKIYHTHWDSYQNLRKKYGALDGAYPIFTASVLVSIRKFYPIAFK